MEIFCMKAKKFIMEMFKLRFSNLNVKKLVREPLLNKYRCFEMRLSILFLLLAVSFTLSGGQEADPLKEIENSALQIRQKPGTDKMLAEWLASEGVKEDTIYAFLYEPGSCPRCESCIMDYSRNLKKKGRKFMLITVVKDKRVGEFYNERKGYAADYYVYDTNGMYKTIFSFNNIALDGANMLKMTKTGRLISGYDGATFTNKLFTRLIERSVPMDYMDFGGYVVDDSMRWEYSVTDENPERMCKYNDYKLCVSRNFPLCSVFSNPYFVDDVFLYPDDMLNSALFFKKDTASNEFVFERELSPTEKEKNRFVKIDSLDFKQMTDGNGVHYIICNAWPLDSVHLGLSYSLPNMFYESPGNIAYYNQPCILSRRFSDFGVDTCTVFDFDIFNGKFFYKHFQFCSTGDNIILGCQKITWPVECPVDYYQGKIDMDPFLEAFYETDNPFMAEFDRHTGKLVRRFGQIDDIARKTLTGYYFVKPLSRISGGELAYTDSYSGKVYVADTSDVSKEKYCYEVFKIDDEILPPVDTTKFYSYAYAKTYRRVFCRCIKDMRINPDQLFCIVAYGDMSDALGRQIDYIYVVIDRKTGLKKEYIFPKEVDGCTVFTRGLREDGGKVLPFMVLKKNDGSALLRVYSVE